MNETERDILYEIRNIYVGGDGIILPRERLGVVVGYMVELEMRIRDLTAERDAARDKINAIVAWAESCEESANNPDVDADVAHDRKESVRDIYRLLGIESEAHE